VFPLFNIPYFFVFVALTVFLFYILSYCPLGYGGVNGTCEKCSSGTYKNTTEEEISCRKCDEGLFYCVIYSINYILGYTSTPGSTSCSKMPPCTEHDYTYTLSNCDGFFFVYLISCFFYKCFQS
jgi:hypothetical protein